MELQVYSFDGKKTKTKVTLKEDVFGMEPNEQLLSQAVRIYLTNNRAGSANTKGRGDVSGGGRKPRKQKYPGAARIGSTRTPMYKGGGVAFGPKSRDFNLKMTKVMKKKSLYSALSLSAKENRVTILNNIEIEGDKLTKTLVSGIKALNLNGRVLVVTAKPERRLHLASRNLPDVEVKCISNLNTYDVLKAENLVILKDALDEI